MEFSTSLQMNETQPPTETMAEISNHGQGDCSSQPIEETTGSKNSAFHKASPFIPFSTSTPRNTISRKNRTDILRRESYPGPSLPSSKVKRERLSLENVSSTGEILQNSICCTYEPLFTSSRLEEQDPFESASQNNESITIPSYDSESLQVSQLQTTLDAVLLENSTLKEELENKTRQLKNTKRQVKVLLELEDSEPLAEKIPIEKTFIKEGENILGTSTTISKNMSSFILPKDSTSTALEKYSSDIIIKSESNKRQNYGTQLREEIDANRDCGESDRNFVPLRILPECTLIMIREITSRIEVHQVREKMLEGLYYTNQLIAGGTAGWVGAYLVKNFGKTVFTALGGGALILAIATKKGFIEVNWNEVLKELQRRSEQHQKIKQSRNSFQISEEINASSDPAELTESDDWTVDKIEKSKKWISENSVAVTGFLAGFFYNIL